MKRKKRAGTIEYDPDDLEENKDFRKKQMKRITKTSIKVEPVMITKSD
jgi:hypothetical protein